MRRPTLILLGLIWAASISINSTATAATYYVSLSGNDSTGTGAIGSPWRSLPRACQTMASGDTLYIRAGTYTATSGCFPSGASWDTATTIAGYPGEIVIFQNANAWTLNDTKHYIIFQDMIWDGTGFQSGGSLLVRGCDHIRFLRLEIRHVRSTTAIAGCDYCEYLQLRVHDNGVGSGDHGMYTSVDYGLVDGGEWYNNTGYALQLKGRDDGSGPQPDGWVVRNVTFWNTRTDVQEGAIYSLGIGNQFYNNTMYRFRCGAMLVHGTNNSIWNNTLFGNANLAYNGQPSQVCAGTADIRSGSGSIRIQNNLIYASNNNYKIYVVHPETAIVDHNQINDGDPQFASIANNDFHIGAGSAARDVGATIASVATDKDGNARPSGAAYDIGAYEYGAGTYQGPLVGEYLLNNNVTDSSGTGNNGTATSITYESTAPTPVEGGYSALFNASSDVISIPTSRWRTLSFTVELWAYADSLAAGYHFLVGHTTTPGRANRIDLYTNGAALGAGVGGSQTTILNAQTLSTATWYHLALVGNGTQATLYVNGVQRGQGTYSGLTVINPTAWIGNNGGGNDEAWLGNIDKVRIYNTPRTTAELLQSCNEGASAAGITCGQTITYQTLDLVAGSTDAATGRVITATTAATPVDPAVCVPSNFSLTYDAVTQTIISCALTNSGTATTVVITAQNSPASGSTVIVLTHLPSDAITVTNNYNPGASRYASPSGGGTACTVISTPCTIDVAVGQLQGSERLVLRAGTYNYAFSNTIPSGALGTPTIVSAYASESVIIRPSSGLRVVNIIDRSNVTFDGLTLDGINVTSDTVKVESTSTNIIFDHVTIENSFNQGLLVGGTTNFVLRNSVVHDNNRDTTASQANLLHGIYLAGCHQCIIEDNRIYNNRSSGIQLYNLADPPQDARVRRNVIYNNGGSGIIAYGINFQLNNNLIYHNGILLTDRYGLQIGSSGIGGAAYNNVVHDQQGGGGALTSSKTGFAYRNNVLLGTIVDTGSNTVGVNNLLTGVSTDIFVDPTNSTLASRNYHLTTNSAAIDIGSATPCTAADVTASRCSPAVTLTTFTGPAPDAGAFESAVGIVYQPLVLNTCATDVFGTTITCSLVNTPVAPDNCATPSNFRILYDGLLRTTTACTILNAASSSSLVLTADAPPTSGSVVITLEYDSGGTSNLVMAGTPSSCNTGPNTATSLSCAHDSGAGAGRIVVVGVGSRSGTENASGVTYGGQAMTLLRNRHYSAANLGCELWYLVSPSNAGSNNVIVSYTTANRFTAGAVSYQNVLTTAPFSSSTSSLWSSVSSSSINLTSAPGHVGISIISKNNSTGTYSAQSPQTLQWTNQTTNATSGNNAEGAMSTAPGAASLNLTWLHSQASTVLCAADLAPGGSGSSLIVTNNFNPPSSGTGLRQDAYWCRADGRDNRTLWEDEPSTVCRISSPGSKLVTATIHNTTGSASTPQDYVLYCSRDNPAPESDIGVTRVGEPDSSGQCLDALGVCYNISGQGIGHDSLTENAITLRTASGTYQEGGRLKRQERSGATFTISPGSQIEMTTALMFARGITVGTRFSCEWRPFSGVAFDSGTPALLDVTRAQVINR